MATDACVSASWCKESSVAAPSTSNSCISISVSVAGSCVSATGCCVAASRVSDSCNSTSMSVGGSCVSATGWVAGSCVSATLFETDDVTTPWASGSCVSVPVGGIGKDHGVWEDVRRINRICGGSRVVVIQGGLIEDLIRFLHKNGGKGAICCRFRGGLS